MFHVLPLTELEVPATGLEVVTPLVPGWEMVGSVVMLIYHTHTHTKHPQGQLGRPDSKGQEMHRT